MPDLREQLLHCFQGRVCLMGIGNADSGDDGFGVLLAEGIVGRLTASGHSSLARNVITGGTTPERMTGSVTGRGFDHLLFLDAVEFGGEPGSVIFLDAGEIAARFPQLSTHKITIGLLARCITAEEGPDVWLLGVQPGSLKPVQGLSPAVQRTKEILEEMLCEVWMSAKETEDAALYQGPDKGKPNNFEPPRREGRQGFVL